MATVQTARGAIDSAQLGVTLMHEHIFVLSTEIMLNYPEEWGDEERRITEAVDRMNELHSRGVHSVVDLTVIGLGRYIPRIARVAERTPLNIVVATGIYTYNDIPFYFHFRGPGTVFEGPEPMVDMFVRDIEHGVAGRKSKPGFSNARPTRRDLRQAWSGCCARWRRRIARPEFRFRRTRTPARSGGLNSSRFFARKAWTCRAW